MVIQVLAACHAGEPLEDDGPNCAPNTHVEEGECLLDPIPEMHEHGRAQLIIEFEVFTSCFAVNEEGQREAPWECGWEGPDGWTAGTLLTIAVDSGEWWFLAVSETGACTRTDLVELWKDDWHRWEIEGFPGTLVADPLDCEMP